MDSNGTNGTAAAEVAVAQKTSAPQQLPRPTSTTDLYTICRLCLNTLNTDEGESVFNNQVPSLPEKIYRVFGVNFTCTVQT